VGGYIAEQGNAGSAWIATANSGFAQYGQEEIRRLFPEIKVTLLVPAEIFMFEVPVSRAEAVRTILDNEPIFIRHIQPVEERFALTEPGADLARLASLLTARRVDLSGTRVAVQIRKAPGSSFEFAAHEAKAALDETLRAIEAEPAVRHADWIVSVFAGKTEAYFGISRPEDNLSDWAGGAVRFQKEEEQISRAKFKLLEAERAFGLDFASCRNAVDIGAAPGGWTSLLLERGLRVTAIDPAALHPSLNGHPRLTFLRKTADAVKFQDDQFELLVCDMSWNPKLMAKLIADLLYALAPGGIAIITVKLMHKKPFQTLRDVLDKLSPPLTLVKAKQLFHNREEFTLYLRKQ